MCHRVRPAFARTLAAHILLYISRPSLRLAQSRGRIWRSESMQSGYYVKAKL